MGRSIQSVVFTTFVRNLAHVLRRLALGNNVYYIE